MHSLVVKLPSLSLLSFCYVMLLCVCVLWVGDGQQGGSQDFLLTLRGPVFAFLVFMFVEVF